ncbi:hypothetical protein EV138_1873 [Kribbella voronezhensis]|uniref:Uncharacterized protein n=1 Tax=Kribbella voronezhensis TaxID=2512212 RepID=A0A4R7T9I8_9ACTN|nr:hypothetical protein [Kribbella voronezhensis]TDU88329.1 hypothetical protein EV138_1873 [Kribbella voronezhensis]
MTNLNDSLPDLMRRATEHLEPESTDLVERGMQRGAVLRRRRTALLSVSAVGAVLATAGIVVGGTQLFGSPDQKQAPVAGAPTKAVTIPTKAVPPATGKDTLATLRKLIPAGLQVSKPTSMDGGLGGQNSASVVVNDGKGASWLMVTTGYAYLNPTDCSNSLPNTCTIQPDGSALEAVAREAISRNGNLKEASSNSVMLTRPNGTQVALTSMSAAGEGSPVTRKQPLFSLAELAKLAASKSWGFPPKMTVQEPAPPTPKPPVVPVQATLATLKKVIPGHPQLSGPTTRGGGTNGYNGASYLTNDGKGASLLDVMLTTGAPVKKCQDERGLAHCKVRSDGSVLLWEKNIPSYGDSRQQRYGILGNSVTLYYPDGRTISLWSFNGLGEKAQVKHTRATPAYTTEQLTTMADSKLWVFPGGTK